MSSELASTARLAVLIDADNANAKMTEGLLAEIAKFGVASVKRAYGNWTSQNLAGWKSVLLDHAIQPMQQFSYTNGKNATDSAMIIDAMDLLHSRRLDGFCIVSSDSDFTGLARRIREDGLIVVGFGEAKTPRPFVAACDRFVYMEFLLRDSSVEPGMGEKGPENDASLVKLIRDAIEATSDDAGWSALSAVGDSIYKQQPDFDPRKWGVNKLSDLVKAMPRIVRVEERSRGDNPAKHVFIRDRRAA